MQDYAKRAALYDIARAFVAKATKGFDAADEAMGLKTGQRQSVALMPQGDLMFSVALGSQGLVLDNMVNAQGKDGRIYVSLADYFGALQFPIVVDAKSGTAKGWFIREDKQFALDLAQHTVTANKNQFTLSNAAYVQDNDIFVPTEEVASWFGFKTETEISELQLHIKSPQRLPIEERLSRADRKKVVPSQAPQFPLVVDGKDTSVGYPIVGVSSLYSYNKDHDGKSSLGYSSSVLTNSDFMQGRLSTQAQMNDQDKLSSLRAAYIRESMDPELLGPLKARRYELGDTLSVRMPVEQRVYQGTGVRVSNIDPTRVFSNSSTGISGNAPPGWDVELYRGGQYLAHQATGTDGFYHFDNVDLFRSANNFRVVLYGPQGEIQEQEVSVPVDPYRLAESGSAYDVSMSFDNAQLYQKTQSDRDEREKEPRIAAIYENPLGDDSAYDIGFTSGLRDTSLSADDEDNNRIETLHGGISTVVGSVLFNAGAAIENTGEAGAQLVARADYGIHQFRNEIDIGTKEFDATSGPGLGKVFADTLEATGPLSFGPGHGQRYNVNFTYGLEPGNVSTTTSILGYSTLMGRVAANQQVRYITGGDDTDGQLFSDTALRGSWRNFYIRGDLNYRIAPEANIDTVSLDIQRPVSETLDVEAEHSRQPEQDYSENRLQMNWRTPIATISPSITRTSNGDTLAYVSTSFSAMREPNGKIRFSNQVLGANGMLNVLVFLDKNGNGVRDPDEEVIPDVTVDAPQNGGQAVTDKDGYAHIDQLQNFRQTDLSIVADTLKDPFWMPASRGVSFLPREGHITELTLPVVLGGQIEGNVFTKDASATDKSAPAHGVSVSLYNHAGEKIMSTVTEFDGYYIFSPVLPGDYYLMVDETGLPHDLFRRPDPAPIKVGYNGDDITGQNIYLTRGADVPVRVISDATALEKQDPAMTDKTLDGRNVVLNLGAYHSRVLMGVMWFKVRALGKMASGLQPLVEPSDSYADAKTGEHTLRIGAPGLTLKDASDRCRSIAQAGISCTVEVLPGGMVLADAKH